MAFFESVIMRKLSIFVFLLCLTISFYNTVFIVQFPCNSKHSHGHSDREDFILLDTEALEDDNGDHSLEYDFYRETCPRAEKIIRDKVHQLYMSKPSVAPALLRLAFHDCFIEGCDASILLDGVEGMDSEKNSPPNQSLKGFDAIDLIKSEVEEVCPGIVSCADIVVVAAREAVILSGGPFYPLNTGRRDSTVAYYGSATNELPSPDADLSETMAIFSSKGFDERETVSLLGAHSTGVIHCQFFENRLYNFSGTKRPDPSLDSELLNQMRSKCSKRHSSSSTEAAPSPCADDSISPPPQNPSFDESVSPTAKSPSLDDSISPTAQSPLVFGSLSSLAEPPTCLDSPLSSSLKNQETAMTYRENSENRENGAGFGTVYYRSLLQGKGIMYSDQQLMAGDQTGLWVRAYASDTSLYNRDFALAMMKLSQLHVLTATRGQIRRNCSRVA